MDRKTDRNATRRITGVQIDKADIVENRVFTYQSEAVVHNIIEKLISFAITNAYKNEIDEQIPDECWCFMKKMLNNFVKVEFMAIDRDDINFPGVRGDKKQSNDQVGSILGNLIGPKEVSVFNPMDKTITGQRESDFNLKRFGSLESDDTPKVSAKQTPQGNNEEYINFARAEEFIQDQDEDLKIKEALHIQQIPQAPQISQIPPAIFYDNKFSGFNDWSLIEEPASNKIDRAASTVIKVVKYQNSLQQNIAALKNLEEENKIEQVANETGTTFSRPGTFHRQRVNAMGNTHTTGFGTQINNNALNQNPKNKKKNYFAPDMFPNTPIEKENLSDRDEEKEIEELRKVKKEEWKKKEEEVKVKQKTDKEVEEKKIETVKKQKEYERKNVTTDVNGNVVLIRNITYEKLNNDFINPRFEIRDKGEVTNPMANQKPDKSDLIQVVKRDDKSNLERTTQAVGKKDLSKNNPSYGKKHLDTQPQLTTQSEKPEKYVEKAPIIPAGSSFDLMSPEVGVTIKEGVKSKSGGAGKDFFRAFKKYSKYDYMTMLKDSNNTNYSSTLKDINFENNEYTMNMSEKMSSSLPKIQENLGSIKSQYAMTGSIKMNTKYGSLKSALDGLDMIHEYEENISLENDDIKNTNLFKTKKGKTPEEEQEAYLKSLEEINKFNFSIVKNSAWGTGASKRIIDKSENKTHVKPNFREIEREVGKNVAKTKLPRSRVFSYVNPPQSMNETAGSSFGMNKTGKISRAGDTKTSKFNKTAGADGKFNNTTGNMNGTEKK